jgi:hypothetical protein
MPFQRHYIEGYEPHLYKFHDSGAFRSRRDRMAAFNLRP